MPAKQTSENERRARSMLSEAIQRGMPALKLMAAFGHDNLPALSDAECIEIAINYPFDWRDIRETFPAA